MSHKRDIEETEDSDKEEVYDIPDALHGVPVSKEQLSRPRMFKSSKNRDKRLIIILEKANLECVKIGKKFELINCDDHLSQIRKFKKDPAFCRPDITHQCLLMLFDSPLNRAGLLQVYIHTDHNILIEINPQTRFPRTFKRFSSLMGMMEMVIKNPITSHLPVGCKKISTSFQSKNLIHPKELIPEDNNPIVVVIGAMAHGSLDLDYTEETVSISQYPLSAALACTKICSAFEEAWEIH